MLAPVNLLFPIANDIPVYSIVHTPGTFVVTFPQAYHVRSVARYIFSILITILSPALVTGLMSEKL